MSPHEAATEAATLDHMLAGVSTVEKCVAELRVQIRRAHKIRTGESGESGTYVEDRTIMAVLDAIDRIAVDFQERRDILRERAKDSL